GEDSGVPYYIEPMQQEDVPEVSQVERRCFTNPWPTSAYRRELRSPENNAYVVLRWRDPHPGGAAPGDERSRGGLVRFPFARRGETAATKSPIYGFAGMWVMLDEAHVTTIGVAPGHRGRSLGEYLFITMIEEAIRRRARWVTLEVRVSNAAAQGLYEKYGFTRQGLRKRYYSDNGEDAHIMWSPDLTDPATLDRYRELKAALLPKLARWDDSLDGAGASAAKTS
ncbi:MAG TPA: ribosomal protein S18-alanine N-acetyltransferase, partial [Thermomicrobiales bacterium]|nr:ribosomal protein S18-alanine N-acetyltransferase [Thermomicrobiales bacterium]